MNSSIIHGTEVLTWNSISDDLIIFKIYKLLSACQSKKIISITIFKTSIFPEKHILNKCETIVNVGRKKTYN